MTRTDMTLTYGLLFNDSSIGNNGRVDVKLTDLDPNDFQYTKLKAGFELMSEELGNEADYSEGFAGRLKGLASDFETVVTERVEILRNYVFDEV